MILDELGLESKLSLLGDSAAARISSLVEHLEIDDALDVLTEEATEDLLGLSGSFEPARDRTRSLDRVFYRLPWLLVTVAGEIAVALVLAGYIGELERVITLALFIPIVSATAGALESSLWRLLLRQPHPAFRRNGGRWP